MHGLITRYVLRGGRVLSLVLLSVLGTSALMYAAPGYFTDSREMDAAHASVARTELRQLQGDQRSLLSVFRSEFHSWAHGDLGRSRQFDTPVGTLMKERAARSFRLLLTGVLAGWSVALLLAVPLSMRHAPFLDVGAAGMTAVLLALPVGVLATVCLLRDTGGPVTVLAIVIAARDFKLLHRMMQSVWRAPFVLHAHTQGMSDAGILRLHVATALRSELLSVVVMSFTLALSALVPIEVIFDVPGLGQLAWLAAMNRDLPVLAAVTAVVSTCVGLAACVVPLDRAQENAQCA